MLLTRSNKVLGIASISKGGISGTVTDVRIGIKKDKLDEKIINQNLFADWFPFPVNQIYKNSLTKFKWPVAVPFGEKLAKLENIPIELCVENCLVPYRKEKKSKLKGIFQIIFNERSFRCN